MVSPLPWWEGIEGRGNQFHPHLPSPVEEEVFYAEACERLQPIESTCWGEELFVYSGFAMKYPMPGLVRISCGRLGSASSFCRKRLI